MIYLVGGQSEVAVRQSVGRGTRGGPKRQLKNPWTGKEKMNFLWIDFDVRNIQLIHRHANARRRIYRNLLSAPREISLVGSR